MTTRTLLLGLLLLLAGSVSIPHLSYAQMEDDDDFPRISFETRIMQGAQFIRTEDAPIPQQSDDAEFGFQRLRYNLEVSAELHERVSLFVDLGQEPNDFGSEFAPVVDYAALDLGLSDEITLRLGIPVTGLFNFRGYSDGAAVQGNPLIGNSPIDFVTAETGAALVGNYGNLGWDLTMTSPTFFESFAPGTGFTLIGKVRATPEGPFKAGAAVALGTNQGAADRGRLEEVNFIAGDGENYNLPGFGPDGAGQPNRYTHAYLLPGAAPFMVQADAQLDVETIVLDAWGGFGTEGNSFVDGAGNPTTALGSSGAISTSDDSQMWWLGSTVKFNVSDMFYLAGRGTLATNSSDWASDLDETSLWRIQAGFGVMMYERGLLKLEFVHQNEGINSPGQVGENWTGVSTEFSIGF